jgi:pimeloyl-ACP methyl ester carboxylesterase
MKAVPVSGESHTLRYIELPGTDPPLVWLHGLMCSATAELLPAAVQRPLQAHRSLVVDFLGYGYSDKPESFGYTLDDHAQTVLELLSALEIEDCVLVGHSMGGTVATLVAAARPDVVSVLVLAEAEVDPGGATGLAAQAESDFVAGGFSAVVNGMRAQIAQDPTGLGAVHLGMTAIASPYAIHRGAVALERGTTPPMRQRLAGLAMPRYYLKAENSEKGVGPQEDLVAAGVTWKYVANSGHAMGLQNPEGFAEALADVLGISMR